MTDETSDTNSDSWSGWSRGPQRGMSGATACVHMGCWGVLMARKSGVLTVSHLFCLEQGTTAWGELCRSILYNYIIYLYRERAVEIYTHYLVGIYRYCVLIAGH